VPIKVVVNQKGREGELFFIVGSVKIDSDVVRTGDGQRCLRGDWSER
jgi:hypothetical protein